MHDTTAITAILAVSCLAFPVVFLLDLPPVVQQMTASIAFAVAALVSLNALFLPKALALSGEDADDLSLSRRKTKLHVQLQQHLPQSLQQQHSEQDTAADSAHTHAIPTLSDADDHHHLATAKLDVPDVALKGKSFEQKMSICLERIELWQRMLLQIGEDSDFSTSQSQSRRSTALSTKTITGKRVAPLDDNSSLILSYDLHRMPSVQFLEERRMSSSISSHDLQRLSSFSPHDLQLQRMSSSFHSDLHLQLQRKSSVLPSSEKQLQPVASNSENDNNDLHLSNIESA